MSAKQSNPYHSTGEVEFGLVRKRWSDAEMRLPEQLVQPIHLRARTRKTTIFAQRVLGF